MKKMMFNDRLGLTQAVIEKRKTVTRRLTRQTKPRSLANCLQGVKYECMVDENGNNYEAPYYVGEIVAVSQSYKDAGIDFIPFDLGKNRKWGYTHRMKAWFNKMFVYADLMPHQIRILDVRAEKLQDITEGDCLREYPDCDVIRERHVNKAVSMGASVVDNWITRRDVFAKLIDNIIDKGTWERNPFVWRIEFELITKK